MRPQEVIFGVDPGTLKTGYGIVGLKGSSQAALDYGCIAPPSQAKLSERYLILFEALETLLDRYQPTALAIETQFLGKNFQSALKLGQARGIAILAAKKRNIPIFEYSPKSVKKAVGCGNASKEQVQELVKILLSLPGRPQPSDAADALAVALCHFNALKFYNADQWEI